MSRQTLDEYIFSFPGVGSYDVFERHTSTKGNHVLVVAYSANGDLGTDELEIFAIVDRREFVIEATPIISRLSDENRVGLYLRG